MRHGQFCEINYVSVQWLTLTETDGLGLSIDWNISKGALNDDDYQFITTIALAAVIK